MGSQSPCLPTAWSPNSVVQASLIPAATVRHLSILILDAYRSGSSHQTCNWPAQDIPTPSPLEHSTHARPKRQHFRPLRYDSSLADKKEGNNFGIRVSRSALHIPSHRWGCKERTESKKNKYEPRSKGSCLLTSTRPAPLRFFPCNLSNSVVLLASTDNHKPISQHAHIGPSCL